jgi:hypothetical protein
MVCFVFRHRTFYTGFWSANLRSAPLTYISFTLCVDLMTIGKIFPVEYTYPPLSYGVLVHIRN